MRPKKGLDVEAAITDLAVGEALVSLLDSKGRPSETERVFVLPPGSQLGPISTEQRQTLLSTSLVAGVYEKAVDRDSAYEKLKGRAPAMDSDAVSQAQQSIQQSGAAAPAEQSGWVTGVSDILFGSTGPRGGRHDGVAQLVVKSAVRTVGSAIGREIVRGVLGGLLGGGGRRR
jgi:hypothetical protein